VLEKDIIVNPSVSASFTPNFGGNSLGCNPLTVSFSNSTVFTGGAAFNGNYNWDFGDGASSIQANPTHEFVNPDPAIPVTYTVTLTSTSVHGCVDVATYDIEVQPRLEAAFSMNPGNVCSPTDVTFTPSSVGATRYLWDFDGIIPNEERFNNDPFTYSFTSSDPNNTEVKTITLTVENTSGCTDVYSLDITLYPLVISNFSASIDEGCSDLEVTFTNSSTGGGVMYNWDFDDEQTLTTSSNAPITHIFSNRTSTLQTYNVKLVAANASGCTSEHTVPITVYPKVEADFTFDYDSTCTPFNVTFQNGSLNGNEYQWDFGHLNQDSITYNKNPFIRVFDNPSENDILTYSIRLIALDNVTGCTDTITKTIEVYPRVVSNFTADSYTGCNPLDVQFTNSSTGLGTYLWEFDDETSSSDVSPQKIFSHSDRVNSRDYTVRLTATNANGCKSVNEQIITVYPLVEADFSIVDADGCTPFTLYLDNSTVSSAYTYSWDFGDGQSSSDEQPGSVVIVNNLNPLAIFQPNIVLTTRYTGDQTCMATQTKQVSVYPHIYPDFTVDLEGCHPHAVTFLNQTDAFGGLASPTYVWDFKNGTFSNEVNPPETFTNTSFTQDSLYDVMLMATSIHGCVDSVTQQVVVHPNPRARMELLDDNVNCSPFEVEFVNISEGVNLSFHYDFGDGADSLTTSYDTMVHVFRNLTSDIQPYMTTLTAETEYGCTHQFFQTLWVYPEVEADFFFDPGAEHCNPGIVTMVNQSVNTWYYIWDFGDGSTSYLYSPTNTFLNLTTETRVFNVTLTALSEYDCEQSKTLPLTVYPQPEADFSINPPLRIYPEADFLFTNQTLPASEDWNYRWDFNDGKPASNQMHPGTYTYETWGPASEDFQYFVTLFVENDHCSDQITHPLTLLPAEPEALFEVDYYASCPPLDVRFINASSYGDSYLWDFGDGITSTDQNPSHTFYEPGFYNVSLTVFGDGGTRTFFDVLQVYPLPIADFAVLPEIVVLPEGSANFYNLSEGASAYLWDFGDGALSTQINPVHKYEELGDYTVELIAYTNFNCTDTLTRNAAVIVEGAGLLRFPNAFVPSKTGPSGGLYNPVDFSNQIFHPIHEGVIEYKLLIFNRWGEQIFESNDVRVGWDGYFNGVLSAQDVYVWRAKGKFSNGKDFDMRGNVTLLR
jgi:PKD repeat protein